MNRTLLPHELPFLDLILANDTRLAAVIFVRLDAMTKAASLTPPPVTAENTPPAATAEPPNHTQGKELEDKIVAWLTANPGPKTPAEIQAVHGATKATKRAVSRLVEAKRIKWNGKRGQGSAYEGR